MINSLKYVPLLTNIHVILEGKEIKFAGSTLSSFEQLLPSLVSYRKFGICWTVFMETVAFLANFNHFIWPGPHYMQHVITQVAFKWNFHLVLVNLSSDMPWFKEVGTKFGQVWVLEGYHLREWLPCRPCVSWDIIHTHTHIIDHLWTNFLKSSCMEGL